MGIKIESKISVAQLINKIRFLTLITGNDEEAYLRAEGAFSVLYWLNVITEAEYDDLLNKMKKEMRHET